MVLKTWRQEAGRRGRVSVGSNPFPPSPISPVRAVSAGDRPSAQRAGCVRGWDVGCEICNGPGHIHVAHPG